MRFIRVRGRIVPIDDSKQKKSLTKPNARPADFKEANATRKEARISGQKADAVSGGAFASTVVFARESIVHSQRSKMHRLAGNVARAATSLKSAKNYGKLATVGYVASLGAGIYAGRKAFTANLGSRTTFSQKVENGAKRFGSFLAGAAAVGIGYSSVLKGGSGLAKMIKARREAKMTASTAETVRRSKLKFGGYLK